MNDETCTMQSVSSFISHRSSLRNMRLLIVIVNYRTASLVIDCLRSLADQVAAIENCRVIITDNASGDDSVQRLRSAIEQNGWGKWAQLQPLEHNGGFAA